MTQTQNHFISPVIASSGMVGFFGEGYPYHKYLYPFKIAFKWITFQSKTATADTDGRLGNMDMEKDWLTPKEFKPKCISADLWHGVGVNNISLTNMGLKKLLEKGLWQNMEGEVHISIMLASGDPKERIQEAYFITECLMKTKNNFKASKVFLHWNISCPNTGHDAQKDFLESFNKEYEMLSLIGWPIMLKVGWQFPFEVAREIQKFDMIYGFDAINTIPFNELPDEDKKKYFKFVPDRPEYPQYGDYVSPLDKYQDSFRVKGRGGISGRPIRKYALDWIACARFCGITKPIIGGGGILNPWHVYQFKKAGATAISPGSITFLRPWNLLLVVLTAKFLFRNGH
jgi:dihydroorotate dehydrogenase